MQIQMICLKRELQRDSCGIPVIQRDNHTNQTNLSLFVNSNAIANHLPIDKHIEVM